MKTVKELHIFVGLPGSGKSTLAEKYRDNDRYSTNPKAGNIMDFDEVYKKAGFRENLTINREKIEKMKLPIINKPYVIVDGLFIDQNEYEWVIGLFVKGEQYANVTFENIVIDYWIPNKEACLWNDRGRRNVSSSLSINLIDIEEPNAKKIEKLYGIPTRVKKHTIVRKPAYLIMAGENGVKEIHDGKYLRSDSWCLGGTEYGWNGGQWALSAEEQLNFDAFDELLEKICPLITFLQYKKIYKECVTIEEFNSSDYYVKSTSARHVCDLEKLYNMLVDMGIYSVQDK